MPAQLSRRAFTQTTLSTLLTTSLLQTLFDRDAFAADVQPITERWLRDVVAVSHDLKGKALTQVEWQAKIERLFGQVELDDLLRLIDFEKLVADGKLAERGERSVRVVFPKVEGVAESLPFGRQVFMVKKDRSIVPHGHNNMATAFLVLKGEFHGRHYDRVEDSATHMVIRPTLDRAFGPGGASTISDFKDNVHWFKAVSDAAFIFNIHVTDYNSSSGKETGRVYIDPNGEKLSGGLVRARIVNHAEVLKMYG